MDFSEPFFWTRSHFLNRKNGVEMAKNGFKHPTWPARTVFPGKSLEKNGFEKCALTWENTFRSHFFNQKCAKPLAILHLQNSIYFYPFSIKKMASNKRMAGRWLFFEAIFFKPSTWEKGTGRSKGVFCAIFCHFEAIFFIFEAIFLFCKWLWKWRRLCIFQYRLIHWELI